MTDGFWPEVIAVGLGFGGVVSAINWKNKFDRKAAMFGLAFLMGGLLALGYHLGLKP